MPFLYKRTNALSHKGNVITKENLPLGCDDAKRKEERKKSPSSRLYLVNNKHTVWLMFFLILFVRKAEQMTRDALCADFFDHIRG